MKEMNRRAFLKVVGAATGGWVGLKLGIDYLREQAKIDPTFKIEFDKYDEFVSFRETKDLAVRFDKIYDTLPENPPPTDDFEVVNWAIELLPMYEYNGFVEKTVWPPRNGIGFVLWPDGNTFNHVSGRSDCRSAAVLNIRYENPASSWYRDEDWIMVLAHELAHVQQGLACDQYPTSQVENTAQIISWEVVASLVNGGNKKLIRPLVGELRSVAMSSAYGIAIKYNLLDQFLDLRERLSPGAIADARFQRNVRKWATDPTRLGEILNWYNTEPLNMVTRAIRNNDSKIEGLALPPVYSDGKAVYYSSHPQPLIPKLDDLKYFLAHAENLAREAHG